MVSKTSWYIIGITIAFVVAIFALLAILTPDIFAMIVGTVDNALYIALGTLPLLALENGTLALIGLMALSFTVSVLVWHYGIQRWWNNRKQKKQQSGLIPSINFQREPTPEQQPKTPTPQIPTQGSSA